MINSCKDCTRRYEGCHSECSDYKEWKSRRQAETEVIRAKKERISAAYADKSERIRRIAKRYKH